MMIPNPLVRRPQDRFSPLWEMQVVIDIVVTKLEKWLLSMDGLESGYCTVALPLLVICRDVGWWRGDRVIGEVRWMVWALE